MGRDKLKRQLQFKPLCKKFGALQCVHEKGVIHLLHEEIEALYLMDNQGLYQADAAESMGVSRPTFARIIKSAREKVTMMLVTGVDLEIEDEKDDCIIIVASMNKNTLEPGKPDAPFLYLYHIHQNEIIEKRVLENPVFVENRRPGQILPLFCNSYKVNFFIATDIGTGLKSALVSKGVYAVSKKMVTEDNLSNYNKILNNI